MKKKNFILFFLLAVNLSMYSQVGINTENPQTTLDINGDFQIRGEFRAGSSTVDSVAVGKPGQYLISKGPGLPPAWGDMEMPVLNTGDYVLRDTQFAEDRIGITITGVTTSTLTDGSTLDAQWTVLEGLTTSITTSKDKNRIMLTAQTVIQSPLVPAGTSDDWSSALCGIFIGTKGAARSTFKLIAVRQGYMKGGHYPQLAFFLSSSYDDLLTGEYDVVVAYQRNGGSASHTDLPLHVGQGFDTGTGTQVANNFMNKSVVRVDVFEPESDDAGGGIGG